MEHYVELKAFGTVEFEAEYLAEDFKMSRRTDREILGESLYDAEYESV